MAQQQHTFYIYIYNIIMISFDELSNYSLLIFLWMDSPTALNVAGYLGHFLFGENIRLL